MKQKLLFTLMFLMTWGTGTVLAQTNATSLTVGHYYRIKGSNSGNQGNTYLYVNGTSLAGSGNYVDYTKDDNRDIWLLENGSTQGTYNLKNISTGLYINITESDDTKNGGSHSLSSETKTDLTIEISNGNWYISKANAETGKDYKYINFNKDKIYVWNNSDGDKAHFYEVTSESRNGDCTFMLANPLCDFSGGWGENGNIKNANELYWDGTSRKVFEPGKNKAVEQTVSNLAEGTYTVQVAVRGGVNDIAYMKLNDTDVAASFPKLSGGNGKNSTITKDGLVINNYTDGPTDNGGWYLIQGTANVAEGGSLKITIGEKNNNSWWQMCDVKLLKNANSSINYVTGSSNTFVDLTSAQYYFYNLTENQLVKAATNTSSIPNVIVDETCANLKLTDGTYDFGTTAAFTATTVTYDRTFTADRKSTVCLPFALTSEEAAALGKFYTLSSYSSETLHFDEVDAPEAYTPYLFVPSATAFASYSSKAIAATPASPKTSVSGADFIGTMTAQTLKSGGGNTLYGYRASDGVFVQIGETNGAHINPFRAYIQIPGSVGVKAFNVQLDSATGIETVSSFKTQDSGVFNLAGQRVSTPTRGLYIVNGKKVAVK